MRSTNVDGNTNAREELSLLKEESATEYYRSHELFAHDYFIEIGDKNPLRRFNYSEAEFEYIPLLPLHWLASTSNPNCGYKPLVNAVLKVQDYVEQRDRQYAAQQAAGEAAVKPKFTVASAFNMRTMLGTGMPTQVRKGAAWESVSRFVMSLTIGHYERWPQCPDLLRKSPKLSIELPYVTTTTDRVVQKPEDAISVVDYNSNTPTKRTNTFFFSGNFALFGPEMVCSVRNAVMDMSTRNDTVIVNATAAHASTALQLRRTARLASSSVFCLVAKGDSYSSSSFYVALRYGCIPVVVSDWFNFAFPWLIPYEKFVVRVLEADFLLNTHFVADYIRDTIGGNAQLLDEMRASMARYSALLSFNRVRQGSQYHRSLLQHDVYLQNTDTGEGETAGGYTYLPLEALLLELRYSQRSHQYYNNVPCLRPTMCSRAHIANTTFLPGPAEYVFPAKTKVRSVEVTYASSALPGSPQKVGYSVVNDGYQVKGLNFPAFDDVRSHLCRHSSRLIGSYKIVFFMQCVRILWPLHPGAFRPVDNIQRFLPGAESSTQTIARYRGGRYPIDPDGISLSDMHFVSTFHNATRPADWVLTNHPIAADKSRILPFS
jgi:hypothetical protein